jgi:hypothetical protein
MPTATPIPSYTEFPVFKETLLTQSFAMVVSDGVEQSETYIGEVSEHFTFSAVVQVPQERSNQNSWFWGIGLRNQAGGSFIKVNAGGIENPWQAPCDITVFSDHLNWTQNTENAISIRFWNGVGEIHVNGYRDAEFRNCWNSGEFELVLVTGGISQGFVMITKDIFVKEASLISNSTFDVPVISSTTTEKLINTPPLDEISVQFAKPHHDRAIYDSYDEPANYDYGFKIGLPNSSRHLKIRNVIDDSGLTIFEITVDFDNPAFDQFWSNLVILDVDRYSYEPNLRVTKYGNEVRLFIDGIQIELSDLGIDFEFDQFRNITFFTNSSTNEFEDKNDPYFRKFPYLRVSEINVFSE